MGEFGADTLRDSIEAAWALTGRLNKTATDTMKETVQFFAHPQIAAGGEWSKAVEVEKINTPELEGEITHPRFAEHRDAFTVTCRYRLLGGDEVLYDQAEEDIEDMTEEVRRTIKTVYDPAAGTGAFWRTDWQWQKADTLTGKETKMELKRILRLTLTQIKSRSTEVFRGFGGVLTFDLSASSNMDSAPAGDYVYTEAYNVTRNEGTPTVSIMTRNSSASTGKPAKFRGKFAGVFQANLQAKKSDVDGATAEKLDNIYKAQNNGELITAVFLDASTNQEGVPVTLTDSTPMMIINMRKIRDDEDLVRYTVTGDITAPSTSAVA